METYKKWAMAKSLQLSKFSVLTFPWAYIGIINTKEQGFEGPLTYDEEQEMIDRPSAATPLA